MKKEMTKEEMKKEEARFIDGFIKNPNSVDDSKRNKFWDLLEKYDLIKSDKFIAKILDDNHQKFCDDVVARNHYLNVMFNLINEIYHKKYNYDMQNKLNYINGLFISPDIEDAKSYETKYKKMRYNASYIDFMRYSKDIINEWFSNNIDELYDIDQSI